MQTGKTKNKAVIYLPSFTLVLASNTVQGYNMCTIKTAVAKAKVPSLNYSSLESAMLLEEGSMKTAMILQKKMEVQLAQQFSILKFQEIPKLSIMLHNGILLPYWLEG